MDVDIYIQKNHQTYSYWRSHGLWVGVMSFKPNGLFADDGFGNLLEVK